MRHMFDYSCEYLISNPPIIEKKRLGGMVASTGWRHYCGAQLKADDTPKIIDKCPSKKDECPHYQKE